MRYHSYWIQTYTGEKFSLTNPQPENVHIHDIAHALSLLCRFTGHTHHFYSVAQHSLCVSSHTSPENQLWGLLHDATEAYIGDLNKPAKSIPELELVWRPIEKRIGQAIATQFGLDWPCPIEIKHMDLRALATEQRDLMHIVSNPWCPENVVPFTESVEIIKDFESIEKEFLAQFQYLTSSEMK